jgi:pimeloyl-ACP methyl ester carboxylesterase
MAGHSLGGFPVRVFTDMYLSEVAGVVLIDSMTPGQFAQLPAVGQSPPENQSPPLSIPALLARLGIVRLLGKPLGLVPSSLAHDKAAFSRIVRPQNVQAYINEGQGMPASAVEADAVRSFGDLPLIVLTAGRNNQDGWQERQTALLQLSSNSQQVIVEDSDHNIHFEKPEAAIAAILKMVEQVR